MPTSLRGSTPPLMFNAQIRANFAVAERPSSAASDSNKLAPRTRIYEMPKGRETKRLTRARLLQLPLASKAGTVRTCRCEELTRPPTCHYECTVKRSTENSGVRG